MTTEETKRRIKEIIIEMLEMEDELTPEDIGDNDPLFGDVEKQELGLLQDSLIILELISSLAEEFDIEPSDFGEEDFNSVNTLYYLVSSCSKLVNKA